MTNTNGDIISENISNTKSFILLLKQIVENYLECYDIKQIKKFSKNDELLQDFLKSQPEIFKEIGNLCEQNPDICLTHYSIKKRDKDGKFKVEIKKNCKSETKKNETISVLVFKIL